MIRDQESSSPYGEYQNTYLRKISPPSSPASRKCCFDQKNLYSTEPSFLCCCYLCPGTRAVSTLAALGVCCLVVGYTIIGAFTFMALEGDLYQDTAVAASKANPQIDNTHIGTLRSDTVNRLWSITEDLNILYKENWTKLAAEEVLMFQDALVELMRNKENSYSTHIGTVSYQHSNVHKWTFSSSFLYSLTLITTIERLWLLG